MPHGPMKPAAAKRDTGAGQPGRGSGAKVWRTDRDIVPDGRGHGDGIGGGAESSCTNSLSSGRVHKIELERLIREEIDPCNISWGLHEIRDELRVVLSGNGGESDCEKDEKS